MQVALAGVAAAALLTAQVPASYAAGVTSAPSSAVRNFLSLRMLSSAIQRPFFCFNSACCFLVIAWISSYAYCVRRVDPRSYSTSTTSIAVAVQAPSGVKKVVCASNPTSKICLKNSFAKK